MVDVLGEVHIVDLVKMLTRTTTRYIANASIDLYGQSWPRQELHVIKYMIMIQIWNANNRRMLPGYCVLYVVSDSFS